MESRCSSSKSFRSRPIIPSGHISLLTDFGFDDAYVGVMKGVIARINPRATVIDLCHQVPPQNIQRAAFLLLSSYAFFPPGSVHVAVVDPTVGGERRSLCVAAGEFFFVGPDNGVLFPSCARAGIRSIYSLENEDYFLAERSRTFHGRDVFAPVAAHLSAGVKPANMGRKIRTMKRLMLPSPTVGRRCVKGKIMFADRFGNLVSNIDERAIAEAFPGITPSKLVVRCGGGRINGLSETYCDVSAGVALALFDSHNLLELAVREGSASDRFRAGVGSEVCVEGLAVRR